jgi:hypothetical protein
MSLRARLALSHCQLVDAETANRVVTSLKDSRRGQLCLVTLSRAADLGSAETRDLLIRWGRLAIRSVLGLVASVLFIWQLVGADNQQAVVAREAGWPGCAASRSS